MYFGSEVLLGVRGYYKRLCPDFATIARLLNVLSSKEVKFQWGTRQKMLPFNSSRLY